MKKYIIYYNKRNIKIAFAFAAVIFILFFVVSLIYDVIENDVLISFSPFVFAAISVAIASLYTIRFKKMIEKQEKLYDVQFQDKDIERLETTLFLSDEWLIWAGSCAFYKKHIDSINSVRRYAQAGGSSNEITVKTVDGKKYTIWCLSSSNVKRIKKWLNT